MVMKAKRFMKAAALVSAMAIVGTASIMMAACGEEDKTVSATLNIDAAYTGENCYGGGYMGAAMCTTEDTLTIEEGVYTLTKTMHSNWADSAFGEEMGDDYYVTYTFSGTATETSDDVWTLDAATACTYSVDWGLWADYGMEEFTNSEGTEADDETCLEWFYGPYVNNLGNLANVVTINSDGTMSFDGFEIDE